MKIEVVKCPLLKDYSHFKIGGRADNLYFPKTRNEFIYLLTNLKNPLVFGAFSNVLFSSVGVPQDLITTSKLDSYKINGTKITAESGVRGAALAKAALDNSLSGFEFMMGFPGSVGGNVYMNASAFSQSTSDCLKGVEIFDIVKRKIRTIEKSDMKFGYKKSILQTKPYIVLSAEFELKKTNAKEILKTVKSNAEKRKTSQPLGLPCIGSIFKNPKDACAGKLLDDIGAKNFFVGDAKVFERHANFIVNTGNATSSDVLKLMFKMYSGVKEKFGVELRPEIKFFGKIFPTETKLFNILFKQKAKTL